MPANRYWLMKSEPGCYSIDDLARDKSTFWDGVRNYQARNFMRDDMRVGDQVLFYHSNADPTGVAGLARVASKSYPDHTAFDPKNDHYDPKSTVDVPIWMMVDVAFVEKFREVLTLTELKSRPELDGMMVIQRGSRLSVQPVEEKHFKQVVALAKRSLAKEKKKPTR